MTEGTKVSEETGLKTYSPDNPVRVEVQLQDQTGVGPVTVMFQHKDDPNIYIRLDGNGQGLEETRMALTHEVTEDTVPGEYFCSWIYVADVNGHQTTTTDHRNLSFVVVNRPEGDYEPPELKDIQLT